MSSNAPPAGPKRRGWDPPAIGASYVRDHDGSVWHVYQLDRASRQACLKASIGGHRQWVSAGDLARDWTQVPS